MKKRKVNNSVLNHKSFLLLFLGTIILIITSAGIFAEGPGGSTMTRTITPLFGSPNQIFTVKLTATKGDESMAGIIKEVKPSSFIFYDEDGWGGTFDSAMWSINGNNLDFAFIESGISGYYEYKLKAGSSSGILNGDIEWAGGGTDNLSSVNLIICIDEDGDGYNITGGVCGSIDCNDNNPSINPGTAEICNNMDDDCDGSIDEDLTKSCGSGNCVGTQTCSSGTWGDCSSKDSDVGVCAKCDATGTPIYDETQDNDCNDNLYCNGQEECSSLFTCSNPLDLICDDKISCTIDSCNEATDSCDKTPNNALCDNGLWCDGAETCDIALGCQVGTQISCLANSIFGIAQCSYNPDNIDYTWDYRGAFTSVCDENNNECTIGDKIITHTCSINNCGAKCESDLNCLATECDNLDGCYNNIYKNYSDVSNTCLGNCLCTDNQCNNYISEEDKDGDGYSKSCGDCNDNDNKMFPSNLEICDNKNNDCNDNTEDGVNETWYNRSTNCGLGVCAADGNLICENGGQSDTCTPNITNQKSEESMGSCDGLDNDCDGLVDESKNSDADTNCNAKVCDIELLPYMVKWKTDHWMQDCNSIPGCVSNQKLLTAMLAWKNTHKNCS